MARNPLQPSRPVTLIQYSGAVTTMTLDSALFDPTQVYLEIDPTLQDSAWQNSRRFATPLSQWNAYLNQLCLQTLLPWLREAVELRVTPHPNSAALASIWEVVNGTAVSWGSKRLVLLPIEAIDLDDLRIPQEWVDLPDWAADYYIPVQVNPDAGWVQVNGFITHQQLKARGQYDWSDHTYSLSEGDLIPDLNVLWVSRQVAPEELTQAEISPLAPLPLAQANALLQRLSDPALVEPRLAIPFESWAALLAHGGWRQQLLERRRGLPEQRSPLQWLQTGVSQLTQQWGWNRVEFQSGLAAARGEAETRSAAVARQVVIAGQVYELQVFPVDRTANIWRFELHNLTPGGQIPAGFSLKLLTEDLQPFENNTDIAPTAIDQLYIEVALEPGEGVVWEIQPLPEGYEREILRF